MMFPSAHSELAREKMWSRIHLIPLLQAEEDRDLVRRHLADQAREKELLGENIKVYNSDRCVFFPLFSLLSPLAPYSHLPVNVYCNHLGIVLRGQPVIINLHSWTVVNRKIEMLMRYTLSYRYVRPTYAVTPGNVSK